MASGDKIIIPATAAGFFSLLGNIEKGTGDTINLPEGMINIGGNGKGFILPPKTDWDPVAHNDGTITSLALGDDIYVYAVADTSGNAVWVPSKNSTYPDGSSESESRKMGGFHFGRVRTVAQAFDPAATLAQQIIPNSVWDLTHRPACDPTGFVEIIPGQSWASIYLLSVDGVAWPDTGVLSEYNAVPFTGTEGYAYYDYRRLVRNSGMRLITLDEALIMAYGVPQGSTDAGGRTNTGQHSNYGFECVSCLNIDQPSGNVHQLIGSSIFDRNSTPAWSDEQNVGKDSAEDHGQIYQDEARVALFGGSRSSTAEAGARCVVLNNAPWDVVTYVGARAACNSLKR